MSNQLANQSATQNPQNSDTEKPNVAVRVAKLIMVTPDNNNKYYDMCDNGNGTFSVTYGRVGAKGSTATYNMREWDSKIREKVRKGYKDQTHLFAIENKKSDNSLDGIACLNVKQLFKDLMSFARQSISHNYVVTADKVTRAQVEEAQILLDSLVKSIKKDLNIETFNKSLIELYTVIPRRMSHVKDHLIQPTDELKTIEKKLAEEQATLDVMRGQVEINEQQKEQPPQASTAPQTANILEAMGLTASLVENQPVIQMIKNMMGDDKNKFSRAFEVNNQHTGSHFSQFMDNTTNKKTTLFWHGSRNENWLSILNTGLVLRPANAVITGKMFGYGLYFADKFRKSLNYTSLHGSFWARGNANKAYLALYEVHTGTQLHVKHHEPWCGLLTEERLKARGKQYDSVFAEGGADLINNEYIVYNENQCTIKYLVEVSC